MKREFYEAAINGNLEYFQQTFEQPLSKYRSISGNSVLHLYLEVDFTKKLRSSDFIDKMLELDEGFLESRNSNEELLLHVAVKYGQHVVVRYLMDKGNEYLFIAMVGKNNVLALAIKHTRVEILRNMMDEINLEKFKVVENRRELLCIAISTQNYELVEILVMKDCLLILMEDGDKKTSLHYAAEENNFQIFKFLLSKVPLEALKMQDTCGKTIGHIAAKKNNVAALELLVKKVPDLFETIDDKSRNVVHDAASGGCEEALEYFYKNEDQRFCNLLDKEDMEGNTPVHLLALSLTKFSVKSAKYIKDHVIPHIGESLMRAKNNKKLTPKDILDEYDSNGFLQHQKDLVTKLMKVPGRKEQNKVAHAHCERDPTNTCTEDKKQLIKHCKYVMGFTATMSFTLAFSVPGGFNQNQSDPINGGTPMLLNKSLFQAFFITDILALSFSLIGLIMSLCPQGRGNQYPFMACISFFLLLLSGGLGMSSELGKVSWLRIVVLVVYGLPVLVALCLYSKKLWFRREMSYASVEGQKDVNPIVELV